jgi:hypothetical protein
MFINTIIRCRLTNSEFKTSNREWCIINRGWITIKQMIKILKIRKT